MHARAWRDACRVGYGGDSGRCLRAQTPHGMARGELERERQRQARAACSVERLRAELGLAVAAAAEEAKEQAARHAAIDRLEEKETNRGSFAAGFRCVRLAASLALWRQDWEAEMRASAERAALGGG